MSSEFQSIRLQKQNTVGKIYYRHITLQGALFVDGKLAF